MFREIIYDDRVLISSILAPSRYKHLFLIKDECLAKTWIKYGFFGPYAGYTIITNIIALTGFYRNKNLCPILPIISYLNSIGYNKHNTNTNIVLQKTYNECDKYYPSLNFSYYFLAIKQRLG